MKKLLQFTLFSVLVLLANLSNAQVLPTVANPVVVNSATGTGAPATNYATLAAAVTAINAGTAHTGTISCLILAGYSETAPTGGYSITGTGTLAAPITFAKSGAGANPTFTANATLTAGTLTDAIFKIIGGDFITIDGFTLLENANTTTAALTNNMTEFGVALFYATTTNGCQNITIKNCTIDLNRTYQNTFGIYANATHSATAPTTLATATTATGGNSNLTITGNTITDVNQGIVVVGPTAATDNNDNIVIGGSALNANTITNFGTTGTFSGYVTVSGTVNGILVRNSKNVTISNNSITSSVGGVIAGTLNGIQIPASSNLPTGTFTTNINNNSLSLRSGLNTGAINGINLPSGSATATSVLNINGNDFNTFGHTTATASGAITFVLNAGTHLTQSISNNTFTNMSVNTTGSVIFISNSNTVAVGGSQNMNSNAIVTAFNKTGAGGTVTFMTSAGSSPSGVTSIWNLNNFSNITVTGATTIAGITCTDGGNVNHNITNNTITNITGGTSAITAINSSFGGGGGALGNAISGNAINTISSAGQITGIAIGNSGTISSVFNNKINGLVSTGAFSVQGITSVAPTANSIYQNKIYNLEANNASGTVSGIAVSGGTLHTIYNNVIGDLRTPNANLATAISGINISGGTTSNVYHNSVVLNATSTGALFGTSSIFASNISNVTLRNNIFINNSTPAGALGFAVAYRRSGLLTVANYPVASDNNIFYAGTPSANNVIFYDGTTVRSTIADYQTFTATRDIASQTENVAFISTAGANADFLRIALGTTSFAESGGALVSSPLINTDYFNVTRPFVAPVNGGTAVDIGASEFDGIPNLVSCIAPADQATGYVAGAVTSNSAQATITAAASAPSGYLVITSQGAFVGMPANGTVYSPGAALGNGAVIQSNATTSINAIGLPSNTVGTLTIFSYNSGACAGGPKYNLVTPLTGTNTTCAGTPTLPVSNALTATGFTANWTQTGGVAFPITYTIEVTTDAAFAVPIAGSPFTSATTSYVATGLNPQTTYYWRVKGNNTVCDSAFLNSSATTECAAITVFPSVEPFATYLPSTCWKEGDLGDLVAGPATIGAAVSDWGSDDYLNATSPVNLSAKMNIDTASGSEWILSPYYTIPVSSHRVKYNVGATQFGATTAPTTAWEADDFVELLVSTSTTNWTVLKTYNSSNVPSNLGQIDTADLTPYNGQTVRFAFRAFEGAANGLADIDFFVDNFRVEIEPITIVVSAPVAVCNGDATTLTVTSANPNYVYTWSPALGLNTTTGATVIAAPSTTTTYTVAAVDGGMSTSGTVTVTINAAPTAVSVTPTTASVCVDDITALVVSGGNINATATIGTATTFTGSTDELTAFNNRRLTFKTQTIYTAAELIAAGLSAGTISSLSYNINSSGDAATNANYTIQIGATTSTNFATSTFLPTTGMTNVFPAATFTHSTSGWQLLNFATPYVWDGTSNIIVNVTQSGADLLNNAQTFYSTTADNKTNYVFDNLASTTGTRSIQRMNIRFGYSAPAVYSWAPTTDLYTDALATVAYTGTTAATVYHKGAANTYTATATLGTCTKTATSVLTVNPKPTLATVTAIAACENSPSTVTMTGLLPNTAGTFTYTNSYIPGPIFPISGISDASGNFSFVTPNLPLVANGAVITITSGTVTATGCTTAFTGKTVSVVVNPSTSITTQPISQAICVGSPVTFSVVGANSPTGYLYEWSKNNVIIPLATSATFSIAAVTVADAGNYSVVVVGECGAAVTSSVAVLTVNPNLAASVSTVVAPTGAICAGTSATFTATPTNGGALPAYQWKVNGIDVSGQISATFTTTTLANNDTVTVVLTSNATPCLTDSPVASSGITMTVNTPVIPTFTTSTSVCSGDNAFSLPTISTEGIVGTWNLSFDNLNSGSYTFTPSTGQCSTTAMLSITITAPSIVPDFTQVTAICNGDIIAGLPTTSNNGISGNWLPAIDNTLTTLYTFTPTSGQCATTATMTIAVGTSTTWVGLPTGWNNGTPTSTSSAIIAVPYSESANITACTLTVNATTTIPAGFDVTLQGKLTVANGVNFALASNANLIQTRNQANEGAIKVSRQTGLLKRLDYNLWSSPVAGQNLLSFSPNTLANRFYTYNPVTNVYEAIVPATNTFGLATGYLIRVSNFHSATTPTAVTRIFTGVPNNGPVSVAVANDTFNAVGNPYPSSISADAFITGNSLVEPLYFWRKSNTLAASTSYATYTLAGGVGTSANTFDSNATVPNGSIQVGQGFLAKSTSTAFNFTNAMRTGNNDDQFFRTTERNRIWINLTNTAGLFSQAMVAYMQNATVGFDAAIDGKILNETATATTLTSLINNEEFAVQGRPTFDSSDVVALGFKSEAAGNFTIAIDSVDGLFTNGQTVYLKDAVTNSIHNLSSSAYTFSTEAGAFNNRFSVVYQISLATETLVLEANNIVVFKQNQDVIVNTGKIAMKSVKIYDIQGRLLVEKNNVNATDLKVNVVGANQVLLVKVTTIDNIVVTKKVLN